MNFIAHINILTVYVKNQNSNMRYTAAATKKKNVSYYAWKVFPKEYSSIDI